MFAESVPVKALPLITNARSCFILPRETGRVEERWFEERSRTCKETNETVKLTGREEVNALPLTVNDVNVALTA
jgi:hypothetical protein